MCLAVRKFSEDGKIRIANNCSEDKMVGSLSTVWNEIYGEKTRNIWRLIARSPSPRQFTIFFLLLTFAFVRTVESIFHSSPTRVSSVCRFIAAAEEKFFPNRLRIEVFRAIRAPTSAWFIACHATPNKTSLQVSNSLFSKSDRHKSAAAAMNACEKFSLVAQWRKKGG